MRKSHFLSIFLIVCLALTLVHAVFATVIFEDGFESGDFSAWTGTVVDGSSTLETIGAAAYQGDYGAHCFKAAWDNFAYCSKTLASSYADLYVRVYMKINEGGAHVSGVGGAFIYLTYSGNPRAAFGIYNDEGTQRPALRRWGESAWTFDADGTFPSGWFCFEAVATDTLLALYIDGVEVIHHDITTGLTKDGVVCGQFFDWGGHGLDTDIYFDCVVVADAYIGPEAEGETFELYPSINLNFSPTSLSDFYGTYPLYSSIELQFDLSSAIERISGYVYNVFPSIELTFDLSSFTDFFRVYGLLHSIDLTFDLSNFPSFFRTFITQHSINLVFDLSSTIEKITGYVYSLFPCIELTFDLSSVQTFWGEYVINPIINVNFGLSEFTEWISGTIRIFASINLVFDLNNVVSGGIVEGYEVSHAIALAIIAFVLAIIGICIAVTKKD